MYWHLFSDLVFLTTDLSALFGVATGLAIFTALICFVLKLFSRARYSRPRHYANANLAPPILFSSETGQCSILDQPADICITLLCHKYILCEEKLVLFCLIIMLMMKKFVRFGPAKENILSYFRNIIHWQPILFWLIFLISWSSSSV